MHKHNPPLSVEPSPELVDRELEPLLSGLYARDPAHPVDAESRAQDALRGRLLDRATVSRASEAGLFTARRRRIEPVPLADGVKVQTLYRAEPGRMLRPGEPLRALLVELAPGACLVPGMLDPSVSPNLLHRECLVLSGAIESGAARLSRRDYHVAPAGHAMPAWCAPEGAVLFLRESDPAPGGEPFTVFDADAGWPDFAPGIQRRVLWQHDGQAAMLYYAQPGAQVPMHVHGHDEECLMLQGELFLDDLLLQTGDYQLAPTGSGHRITHTDTGVVIYAHGDLDLKFVA